MKENKKRHYVKNAKLEHGINFKLATTRTDICYNLHLPVPCCSWLLKAIEINLY